MIAKPLVDLTEKEWTSQAVGTRSNPGVARMYGFKAYHTLRSKGSEAGFPDWVLVRERVVYLELKAERGKLSPAQKEWLAALLAAGAEAYVVRPRDLDALVNVLSLRSRQNVGISGRSPEAEALRERTRLEVTGGPDPAAGVGA